MTARALVALSLFALFLALAACSEEDCPAGTRLVGGRCVAGGAEPDAGGDGDGDADADGDADGDSDADADADADADGDSDADAGPSPDPDGGCEARSFFRDADEDGWGDDADVVVDCGPLPGWVERGGDCAPADPAVHPEAEERCNAVDDDCANGPDDGFECVVGTVQACDTSCGTAGTAVCSAACTPGACVPPAEVCNYVDDDCDGLVDPDQQELLGEAVRMTAAQGTSISAPRIAWDGESFAVGWGSGQNVVATVRDATLGEVEAPVNVVTDNANAVAMDLVVSGSIWVVGHDAGGAGGTRRYEITELGGDLGLEDDWQSSVGAGTTISKIDAAPVQDGVVALFQTGSSGIRTRSVVQGALGLYDGANLEGTSPDAAPTDGGDVLVATTSAGEAAVALLDQDGDESIGQRSVTDIGLVGRVSITQAGPDTVIAVFETSGGAGPVRSLLLDDGLDVLAEPVEVAAEGEVIADAVASNRQELAVAYSADSELWVVRLDLQGTPASAPVQVPRIVTGASDPAPSIVWADGAWAIVYVDDADDNISSGWDVYARRYGCP